jgi:hypothetical protein
MFICWIVDAAGSKRGGKIGENTLTLFGCRIVDILASECEIGIEAVWMVNNSELEFDPTTSNCSPFSSSPGFQKPI